MMDFIKRRSKKSRVMFIAFAILTVNLSGCGSDVIIDDGYVQNMEEYNGSQDTNGPAGGKRDEDWEKAANNTTGAEAYRRVGALGDYHFDADGRSFCDGITRTGRWVKTEKQVFGEEKPNSYSYSLAGMEEAYAPGEQIKTHIDFLLAKENLKNRKGLWGAIYFADTDKTVDAPTTPLTVMEYFRKSQNEEVNAPVDMSCFGGDNDGRSGGIDSSSGGREYYFDACANFPRLGAEGDTIRVVLDIIGEDGAILTRDLTEYTFRITESDNKNLTEENHEDNSDYYPQEHPGHWTMTDICFIGGDGKTIQSEGLSVSAQRYGVEGQIMVYTFKDNDGAFHRIRIPDIYPANQIYAEDYFREFIQISSVREPEDAPGFLHCSLTLGDVEYGEGKYGIKVTPRIYFSPGASFDPCKVFDVPPSDEDSVSRFREGSKETQLKLEGSFPQAKDGEKLYLVYGVMDDMSREARMYNIYEYTYSDGPDIEWVYNPPMY